MRPAATFCIRSAAVDDSVSDRKLISIDATATHLSRAAYSDMFSTQPQRYCVSHGATENPDQMRLSEQPEYT
jgi:hypothetical protein